MRRVFTSVVGSVGRVVRIQRVSGVGNVKQLEKVEKVENVEKAENVEEVEGADSLLNNLLRVRRTAPEVLYVANELAAKRLIRHLKPHLTKSPPENLLEINPGFGYLTKELLNLNFPKINLFETSSSYDRFLMVGF